MITLFVNSFKPSYTNIAFKRNFSKILQNRRLTGEEFNKLTTGSIHLKVLNEDLCQRGFQYKLGENVMDDVSLFNDDKCSEGLHFTDTDYVNYFLDFGSRVHKVRIPDDAEVYCFNSKCKSTKLIIEKEVYDNYTNDFNIFTEDFFKIFHELEHLHFSPIISEILNRKRMSFNSAFVQIKQQNNLFIQ
jgi:hypothetical protein